MVELLGAVVGVGSWAIVVVLVALLVWALHYAFGPQVLGLPAMLGVFVLVAGVQVFSNVGILGLVSVVIALCLLIIVIGMAMTGGSDRNERRGPPDGAP